jgi:endonuclease YncB( thermonuclease family)
MSVEEPKGPMELGRPTWVAIIAGITLVACLAGFVGGSILISAGVSAYSGWAGVAVTELAVTVAIVSGPTYTPYPTYTLQPTYTPQPTYTLAPTAIPVTDTPMAVVPPTGAPPGVGMLYFVQAGDTPQSVADRFGVDVVLVIAANGLDPANPTLQAGSQIRLPTRAADVCLPDNDPVQATVSEVLDGDTIEVLIEGQTDTVWYIGIEAPGTEPNAEPFGAEALSANTDLVEGQTLALVQDVSQEDGTGQLPRYVLAGDELVNYELARQGYAEAVSTPPDTACDELFALAAAQARAEGLGMWAGQVTGTATPTASPPAWTPPATFTPTATSSLGFNCHCKPNYVWGNFTTPAQAEVCRSICEIAALRKQAACATAMVSGSASAAGCK